MTSSTIRTSMKSSSGFTIPEVLIASTIALISFSIASTALVGFMYSTKTTYEQVEKRYRNHNAMEKMGRMIMESTAVTVEDLGGGETHVHLWRDLQDVWTPGTTDDDVEGLIYLDTTDGTLYFRPDIIVPGGDEIIAEDIEQVDFETVGNALFAKLTMMYDPDTPGSERELQASFMSRNNPKARENASQ